MKIVVSTKYVFCINVHSIRNSQKRERNTTIYNPSMFKLQTHKTVGSDKFNHTYTKEKNLNILRGKSETPNKSSDSSNVKDHPYSSETCLLCNERRVYIPSAPDATGACLERKHNGGGDGGHHGGGDAGAHARAAALISGWTRRLRWRVRGVGGLGRAIGGWACGRLRR